LNEAEQRCVVVQYTHIETLERHLGPRRGLPCEACDSSDPPPRSLRRFHSDYSDEESRTSKIDALPESVMAFAIQSARSRITGKRNERAAILSVRPHEMILMAVLAWCAMIATAGRGCNPVLVRVCDGMY
jgi:hypothetical protein